MRFSINTKDLSKKFGEKSVVSNLNLEIAEGEIFGLIGPDGAGKTTIMRLLTGAYLPTSGSATILNFDLVKESEKIKEKIGYMSQKLSLYRDLTVEENIDFFADIYQVEPHLKEGKKEDLLEFAKLTEFKQRRVKDLSGGMRQKLGLACTLIHEPEILFLDEPTTGVDPVSRREFWRMLYHLPMEVTIVLSTPYMDEAERCTKIGLLYKGELMICDTPDRVKETFKVSRLEDAFVALINK